MKTGKFKYSAGRQLGQFMAWKFECLILTGPSFIESTGEPTKAILQDMFHNLIDKIENDENILACFYTWNILSFPNQIL